MILARFAQFKVSPIWEFILIHLFTFLLLSVWTWCMITVHDIQLAATPESMLSSRGFLFGYFAASVILLIFLFFKMLDLVIGKPKE